MKRFLSLIGQPLSAVYLFAQVTPEPIPRIINQNGRYALQKAKQPAEIHIYSNAGHGFGIRESNTETVADWIERFYVWLTDLGFIKK